MDTLNFDFSNDHNGVDREIESHFTHFYLTHSTFKAMLKVSRRSGQSWFSSDVKERRRRGESSEWPVPATLFRTIHGHVSYSLRFTLFPCRIGNYIFRTWAPCLLSNVWLSQIHQNFHLVFLHSLNQELNPDTVPVTGVVAVCFCRTARYAHWLNVDVDVGLINNRLTRRSWAELHLRLKCKFVDPKWELWRTTSRFANEFSIVIEKLGFPWLWKWLIRWLSYYAYEERAYWLMFTNSNDEIQFNSTKKAYIYCRDCRNPLNFRSWFMQTFMYVN